MDASKILAKSGYKLTKPRWRFLDCLREETELLSARDIFKKTKSIDQASVYRSLGLFEKLGLVNVEVFNKEKLYCLADKPHHHIICRICGRVEKFPCTHKFNKYKDFTEIKHQLTLYGVCSKCKKI
jgi:Fe2+ or Zn2+ uptake regulation protein